MSHNTLLFVCLEGNGIAFDILSNSLTDTAKCFSFLYRLRIELQVPVCLQTIFPGVGYTSFRLLKEDFGRNHQFLLQIVHCLTLGETIAFLIDRSSAVGDPKQKRRSGLDDW